MYGTIMRAKLKPGQKEAYQRNDNYNQMIKFFEGPPEWIDVNYVAFQGEPLKAYMASPQTESRR